MKDSKIEWTHHTFNSWWGCVKVSPGCANCYAATFAKRVGQDVWGPDAPRRFFGDKHWAEPFAWDRAAGKAAHEAEMARARGEGNHPAARPRVFCASMADVFEDRRDLDEPRARLWDLIHGTPNLDWLLLTKRPENALRLSPWFDGRNGCEWPRNIWLGTTCEDQQRADERIPQLLAVPAAVRFLSVEPMLGPVDLSRWLMVEDYYGDPDVPGGCKYFQTPRIETGAPYVGWVIVGGESGHGARSFDPAWAYGVVEQCREAGVACFVKQLGANPVTGSHHIADGMRGWTRDIRIRDPKGGDPDEWPEDLRVREFPEVRP